MSILVYITGYIVILIAIALFLKSIKVKKRDRKEEDNIEIKTTENISFDREKHNDYMNDPQFAYMSCNKFNPKSSFYKIDDRTKSSGFGMHFIHVEPRNDMKKALRGEFNSCTHLINSNLFK